MFASGAVRLLEWGAVEVSGLHVLNPVGLRQGAEQGGCATKRAGEGGSVRARTPGTAHQAPSPMYSSSAAAGSLMRPLPFQLLVPQVV